VHLVGTLDENIFNVITATVSGVPEENMTGLLYVDGINYVKRTLKTENVRFWTEFNWFGIN
jgi:hypothetical protein